eukprot:COSAG04_NODE_11827_length_685_cov_1.781570_1_plen_206_part_10
MSAIDAIKALDLLFKETTAKEAPGATGVLELTHAALATHAGDDRFDDLQQIARSLEARLFDDTEPEPEPEEEPPGLFQVGDKVLRRWDPTDAWGIGFVTQLDPLKVTSSATDPSGDGIAFTEVRHLPAMSAELAAAVAAKPALQPYADAVTRLTASADDPAAAARLCNEMQTQKMIGSSAKFAMMLEAGGVGAVLGALRDHPTDPK